MHEMGRNYKRPQEQREDEVSVQKTRENHETSQHFPIAANARADEFYEMILEIFKMVNQIVVEDCLTCPVSQQRFQVLVLC